MGLLESKDVLITSQSNQRCSVEKLLGGGGQGEVYRASMDGRAVAVKWYFNSWLSKDSQLEERLQRAVEKGAPSDRFLWPEQLVWKQGTPGFGYIMPLREERFKGLVDMVSGKVKLKTPVIARIGLELARGFSLLHAEGSCYQDISFGNVFFDAATGEVRICDNDNVAIDGSSSSIQGTPKFIAPEVAQGKNQPNIRSDQHSLAVLLFYMLHLHHPLEGKRTMRIRDDATPKAQDLLYGSGALFIFDPVNKENEAVTNAVDPDGLSGHLAALNWPLYPAFVRERFLQAFTAGLHDPFSRVTENGWMTTMIDLSDATYACSCGTELCYDAPAVRAAGGVPPRCYNCCASTPLPPRLGIQRPAERSIVLMTPGKKLFPHHIDSRHNADLSTPVAEAVTHPRQPGMVGLKNLSQNNWSATLADGSVKTINPMQVIPLSTDLRIQFGASEARVKL